MSFFRLLIAAVLLYSLGVAAATALAGHQVEFERRVGFSWEVMLNHHRHLVARLTGCLIGLLALSVVYTAMFHIHAHDSAYVAFCISATFALVSFVLLRWPWNGLRRPRRHGPMAYLFLVTYSVTALTGLIVLFTTK